jgi:hypothetical protein
MTRRKMVQIQGTNPEAEESINDTLFAIILRKLLFAFSMCFVVFLNGTFVAVLLLPMR